jgi:hypothetical protein
MFQRIVLLFGLIAFALASKASAQVGASASQSQSQSQKCGAYAYAGAGAWAAARGYPDCEAAKKAAFAACQKRALRKDERDDCLVTPVVGPGLWFQGAWCRNAQSQRMMAIASDPKRENLEGNQRRDVSARGFDPNTCRRLILFHSDDARKVTSGRGY